MMETENSSGVSANNMITPPDFSKPPPNMEQNYNQSNINVPTNRLPPQLQNQNPKFRQPFRPQHNNSMLNSLPDDFDGKRLRKSTMRKTVDYNAAIIKSLENRVWQRDHRDRHALQPDVLYLPEVLPPPGYKDNPINAVTTKFVKTATNKMRCPIFCMAWTPEGRRLVTGASSGEFTLWNGLTFNFETILQAHDSPVRSMVWSNNDAWMITGDHAGYCKYWQSNMNNVKMFQAHKEAIRGLSFSPTDQKMVSCSDDGTLRIWDFARCHEERILRGHGSDVKCCDWHPQLGLIASGSKDNQQPIKLWDPKSGQPLTTLHAHKSTVMDLKWNKNGNWFMTASRDHFLKLFDIRNLSQVVQTFRGHKKEASCLAWHPHHEGLIASGGSDGAILFWHVGADKEVGAIDAAHESIVWTLDWHPLGHILCSGSNDHTSKFWTRNRPGDLMKDKYNLNTLPAGLPGMEENEMDEVSIIPGMAPEDRVEGLSALGDNLSLFKKESDNGIIPGLDDDILDPESKKKKPAKKQPYAKPIPKNFMAQWNETGMTPEEEEEALEGYGTESVLDPINQLINKFIEEQPGVKKLEELEPTAIVVYGKVLPVRPGQKLYKKIFKGREALNKYIKSGKIKELQDVLPIMDSDGEGGESDSDSSSMELDEPNEDEDTQATTFSDSNFGLPGSDIDLRRFGVPMPGQMETEGDFRNTGNLGNMSSVGNMGGAVPLMRDMDLRFQSRDQDFRSQNQVFDEDLRNPLPRQPPPLMGPDYRSYDVEDDGIRRDSKMMPENNRGRDLDLRNDFGSNNFSQGNNFRGTFQGEPKNNFHPRSNFNNSNNNRDPDFRDFDDRSRGSFQRSEMEYRSRDFDSRHRDYDERYDDGENYDGRSEDNYDDRPSFNNSNMYNQNQRWDEGPSQDSRQDNWNNRPPPLMSANVWENNEMDFRNFPSRGFPGSGPNNFGLRKGRGGGGPMRNPGPRSRPRRGRGRFPRN